MIIANPIYDVVFKKMMENERVAKFFIGTLLEQTIESVVVKPQEYTYEGEEDMNDPSVRKALENRVMERLSIRVYRLDFIATIKTETGELRKILIEIQKANNYVDLMRFRTYLGDQYKKEDIINNETVVLPITTIYVLGFKLPEITTPCVKIERNYKDLIEKKVIDTRSDFVEKLTHDSFIVQVQRITDRYQTKLDKLLSIFEQKNFIDDSKIIKQYNYKADNAEVELITDILHHSATDPAERKKIENEQEAWRTVNVMFQDILKELNEKDKDIIEKDEKLIEKDKTITEKDEKLTEKDKTITEMAKELEELKRRLGEK